MNKKKQDEKSPKKRHSAKSVKKEKQSLSKGSENGMEKESRVSHPRSKSRRNVSEDEKIKSDSANLKTSRRSTTGSARKKSVKRKSVKERKVSGSKSLPTGGKGSVSKSSRKKSKKKTSLEDDQELGGEEKVVIPKKSEERERKSKRQSYVTSPYLRYEVEMEKIPSTDKGFLVSETTKECYVCNSSASYYHKGFFCDKCIEKFTYIVNKAGSVNCPGRGEVCDPKQECDFCLAEAFYSHGLKASNITGFQRIARGYSLIEEIPEYPPEIEVEETLFCKYFNRSLNQVLDWFWKQGDILKLNPKDRMTLLEMNIGRARLLWLVIDWIPRHSVIKTFDSYLSITGFSSEALFKTIIDINDMAKFFISVSFTPQHLYFVKLLSIFQIGKCIPCSFARNLHEQCHCDEDKFERGADIKLMSENYRIILHQMHVREGDIQLIAGFIDLLKCMNEVISEEECIENVQVCLKRWIAVHPEWQKAQEEALPRSISDYPKEVHYLCYYLNKVAIEALNCANDYLRLHFSFRDQKVLLYHNMMPLLVASICWKLEPIFGEQDQITDVTVKCIWTELREVENYLRTELSEYVNLPDCQVMFLTRYYPDKEDGLKDINLKDFDLYSRKLILENAEKILTDKYPVEEELEEHIKMLRICTYEIMGKVEKTAEMLESVRNDLPLFINLKSWVTET